MPTRYHSQLILLQPTPYCNIDCAYCYLPDRSNGQRMSSETVRLIFKRCLESPCVRSPFTFLWHAGEPLAVPVAFYRDAFAAAIELNRDSSKTFDHCIQTNGTLLNDRWIELIAEFKVGMGLSLDGPAFLHDSLRRTRLKSGTHASVMKGIRLLQEACIPFHVIAVLTAQSLDYAEEMFRFFVDNGITDVGFNIDEIEGSHQQSSFTSANVEERYSNFMRRFLELTEREEDILRVREFEIVVRTLLSGSFGHFTDTTNRPLHVISFDYLGNISTFSPELFGVDTLRYGTFRMGNVRDGPLELIESNPTFVAVAKEIAAGVQACKASCEYWGFCGGGPPANKFFEHGRFDLTETLFCRIHKKTLVDVVLDYAERTLEK